jgi:DNA-binding response OmpR family regulator
MVHLLSFILSDEGYTIDTANSGTDTLKKLKENKYPLILLDYDLGDMTGFDVIRYMKENNIKSKIIMISGHTKSELKSRAYNMGVNKFIPKPFEINTVLENVQDISDNLSPNY